MVLLSSWMNSLIMWSLLYPVLLKALQRLFYSLIIGKEPKENTLITWTTWKIWWIKTRNYCYYSLLYEVLELLLSEIFKDVIKDNQATTIFRN